LLCWFIGSCAYRFVIRIIGHCDSFFFIFISSFLVVLSGLFQLVFEFFNRVI
jgi:hypothetical protein